MMNGPFGPIRTVRRLACSIAVAATAGFAGALMLAIAPEAAVAQGFELRRVDSASPLGVWVGVTGGAVLTTPRGEFPSLLIGDSVRARGSGAVGAERGETALGGRFSIAAVIPFSHRFAATIETGTLYWVARYAADAQQLPTRFEVQTWQAAVGVQGKILGAGPYTGAGLRSLYAAAALDIAPAVLMNRVETTVFEDDSTARRGVGSFDNTAPFSIPVGARFGLGARVAATAHLELLAEAGYSFALNDVFSNAALPDNDFTVDHVSLLIGLGYRW